MVDRSPVLCVLLERMLLRGQPHDDHLNPAAVHAKFLSFGELYTAQVAAVATVVSIPVVILGWLCQRSLVRGLLFGALK
jgi:ABC-type glycerol-3-phosphate transport system permease component